MGDAGRELLDSFEWVVESAALAPGLDSTVLSSVTFMLDPSLQSSADALLEADGDRAALAAFVLDAVDLELAVETTFTLSPESFGDGFAHLSQLFGELGGLQFEGYDMAGVLSELRVPIFGSQPEHSEAIEKWGTRASASIGAVGVMATAGGHAGAVIVLIAPPLGAAILLGTYGTIGGIALAGYLRKRHQQKQQHKPANSPSPSGKATTQGDTAADAAAKLAASHEHAAATQARLKILADARAHLRPS